MLSIDFNNVFGTHRHALTKKQFQHTKKYLKKYLSNIHVRAQGFYTIVDDMATVRGIEQYSTEAKGKYDDIVVLGIGGSALGITCLRDALSHLYADYSDVPRLHVIDNIDPIMIEEIQDVIALKRTLFVVITKSGGTPETLSTYFYFRNLTDHARMNAKKHFVFITDPERGLLRKIAWEENIPTFDVPQNVGGRFSVLTPVGLLPAALIGIDIRGLLRGAREMRDVFMSKSYTKNLPFQLAAVQYMLATKKGKTINVMMPYAKKLFRFADWYRQLLAESIGKAKNNKGKIVHVGITPVNALGVTDQHSQSQLYNEGPNDKMFMVLAVERLAGHHRIPWMYPEEESVAFLKGTSFNELINVEREATIVSFTKNKRPNLTITISKIDTYHLGQLFMLFEGATAFLGEFFSINAFNQPGVELSKKFTKEMLLDR